jgi:hypothetical protein
LKTATSILPVGRVNDFKPLGHSGQDKLHAVVGSKEIAKGIPNINGFPISLLNPYDINTLVAFRHLTKLSLAMKLVASLIF